MARSVSVPFNAQRVLYINLYDFENYFDQEYALDDFIQAICKRYPSLSPSRKWVGREDLGLAENAHAVVGVPPSAAWALSGSPQSRRIAPAAPGSTA